MSIVVRVTTASVTTTRQRVLDAAIELLGTAGLRALTHNRVDDASGLPRGTTSNYFRTRAALLTGAVDRIVERELGEVGPLLDISTGDDYIGLLVRLFDATTVKNHTLTTARLVLFLESSHDTSLRDALDRGRSAMEGFTTSTLARLGAPNPAAAAQAVMGCLEGLILHRIARHDANDARAAIEIVVRAALSN
jgi:DNA-binding transcriptional regulator YbjK